MRYYTSRDLCATIYQNLHKIPRDISYIVGIARSGMLPATLIAEYLHKPLCSVSSFLEGKTLGAGGRRYYMKPATHNCILLVDDTCNSGTAMQGYLKILRDGGYSGKIYSCAVFGEGKGTDNLDICLKDVRGGQEYFYEWNIFNHCPEVMACQIWDLDGCLCVEPPDELRTKEYEEYVTKAIPLFQPINKIGAICTSRLEKYRLQTENWLNQNGIQYGELDMVNLPDYDSRARWGRYAEHKAEYYAAKPWARLFVESSEWQANRIFQITGKPVLSIESNTLKGWQ